MEPDNSYDVGMTGLIGFSSGYHALRECDTLLMLGTDFPYPQFYPEHARTAQVDVRPEVIGRRTAVELGVIGDVRSTLTALLPRLKPKDDGAFLKKAQEQYRDARKGLDDPATGKSGGRLHPQYVARIASELAASNAVFTCDVGLPAVWAARHLDMRGGRRLLGSFWHGSMACALPLALGAQSLDRGRQVVSFSGDGGFAMLMGELLSLKQLDLPVKVIIFNNGSLGFIELEQKSSGFLDTGTGLENPNSAHLAEAAGIKGVRIKDPAEVEARLGEAFAHPGPAIIDASVSRQELAMPPAISAGMACRLPSTLNSWRWAAVSCVDGSCCRASRRCTRSSSMSSVTSASTRTSTAYRERLELFSGWFEHPIDLPGRWYLQAVDELFRADRFCEGTFIGLGKAIGLGNIACPVSLLAGEHDDITPASQVHEAAKRLATKSADIVHETVPGGHVGLFMSHRTALHPRLDRPSRLRRLEQAGRR